MAGFDASATDTQQPTDANQDEDWATVEFQESGMDALIDANDALFGSHRPASERIYWGMDPKYDDAVFDMLNWINEMEYSLAALAVSGAGFSITQCQLMVPFLQVDKFVSTGQRGVLVINARYRSPSTPNEPSFDWITLDEAKGRTDRRFEGGIAE